MFSLKIARTPDGCHDHEIYCGVRAERKEVGEKHNVTVTQITHGTAIFPSAVKQMLRRAKTYPSKKKKKSKVSGSDCDTAVSVYHRKRAGHILGFLSRHS